jgi:hypothetical protein
MKKMLIKNVFKITIIILFACLSTYFIYNKFHNDRRVDYSSESLDITFREESGDKITLDKVTPLNDSVGLASKSYEFTIKNNLTEKIDVTIKLVKDEEVIEEDECLERLIPEKFIKVAIKENSRLNDIHTINELVDETLLTTTLEPLENRNYNVRVWTSSEMNETNEDLHYHGKIVILENTIRS